MIKTVLLLFCSLVYYSQLNAFSGSASFLRDGVGAEELAMGSAATAGTAGVNSVYWNPAGLTRIDASNFQVASMYSFETLDRHHAYLGAAMHIENFGDMGLSLINYGITNIPLLDDKGAAAGNSQDEEYAAGLSYANKISYQLRYGATIKGHYQDLVGYSGIGYSLDLGLIFQPMLDQEIYFGLMLRNLAGSMQWQGYSEDMMSEYKAGVSMAMFDDALKVSLDAVKDEGTDDVVVRGGVEFRLFQMMFLRGGIDDKYPSAGAGLKYENYKIDYAFVYDRYEMGNVNQVSVALIW
jgi:hypothetical protein